MPIHKPTHKNAHTQDTNDPVTAQPLQRTAPETNPASFSIDPNYARTLPTIRATAPQLVGNGDWDIAPTRPPRKRDYASGAYSETEASPDGGFPTWTPEQFSV